MTFTMARPPLTKPTNAVTNATSLTEMEVEFIKEPAKINKGIAIKGNFVEPSNNFTAAS